LSSAAILVAVMSGLCRRVPHLADDFCLQMITRVAFENVHIPRVLSCYPSQHHSRSTLRARWAVRRVNGLYIAHGNSPSPRWPYPTLADPGVCAKLNTTGQSAEPAGLLFFRGVSSRGRSRRLHGPSVFVEPHRVNALVSRCSDRAGSSQCPARRPGAASPPSFAGPSRPLKLSPTLPDLLLPGTEAYDRA
jgi:hypothetical protein